MPSTQPPPNEAMLRGQAHITADGEVSGWAFFQLSSLIPTVSLELDGESVAKFDARLYRDDLPEPDLHDTGLCGFAFHELKTRDRDGHASIVLRVEQTGQTLHIASDERMYQSLGDAPPAPDD